jgi:hypothetical protein
VDNHRIARFQTSICRILKRQVCIRGSLAGHTESPGIYTPGLDLDCFRDLHRQPSLRRHIDLPDARTHNTFGGDEPGLRKLARKLDPFYFTRRLYRGNFAQQIARISQRSLWKHLCPSVSRLAAGNPHFKICSCNCGRRLLDSDNPFCHDEFATDLLKNLSGNGKWRQDIVKRHRREGPYIGKSSTFGQEQFRFRYDQHSRPILPEHRQALGQHGKISGDHQDVVGQTANE